MQHPSSLTCIGDILECVFDRMCNSATSRSRFSFLSQILCVGVLYLKRGTPTEIMPFRNSITSNFEQRNPSSTFMPPTTCARCIRPLSISISLPHHALSTHSPEQSRFPLLHNFVFEIGFLFISFCMFARLALDGCKSITMLMSSARH